MPIDKEIIEYGIYALGAGVGAIVLQTSFNMVHSLGHTFGESLTQKNKELILEEEKRKLKLDNYIISLEIRDGLEEKGFASIRSDNSYAIVLKSDSFFLTRKTLKHELYHIFKGDTKQPQSAEKENSFLVNMYRYMKYIFIQEPRAMTYANWNIKL